MKEGKLCILCLAYGNPNNPGGSSTVKDILKTDEDLAKHIEQVHCVPVVRSGETPELAKARVKRANPNTGTDECPCPACIKKRFLLKILPQAMARNVGM